jgi:hypothetical protein
LDATILQSEEKKGMKKRVWKGKGVRDKFGH